MSLFSAFDDFLQTSVRAVHGTLGKLHYVSSLRSGEAGEYIHWGLTQVHGGREAQQAMAEVHRLVFSEVLSTPMRSLLEDARKCSRQSDAKSYLDELKASSANMLPPNPSSGSAEHFSSVLQALLLLAQSRPPTILPTS